MISPLDEFWTEQTSVFFTSLWGWTPETWGTIGWSNDAGRTRRNNLLKALSDPFIAVVYVTASSPIADGYLKGMIVGFYLLSHQTGHRDEFTHPKHHSLHPDKWQHSLKALRAFTYLPEYRLKATEFDPALSTHGQSVASMGVVLTDAAKIAELRAIPCAEVDVCTTSDERLKTAEIFSVTGQVKAGPASKEGYIVAEGTQQLRRELYVLRLGGDTDAYRGTSAEGRSIYKIGLSVSPEMRRQTLQQLMPRGQFEWQVEHTSTRAGYKDRFGFAAAVAGEDAMKAHLAKCSEWLGGEFYLATEDQIDVAWQLGHAAAESTEREA